MKFFWNDELSWWANILIGLLCIVIAMSIIFGVMCLNSWLFMLLWNAILTAVFDLSIISFWQAFGLYVMVWLLTGGFLKVMKGTQNN